MSYEIGGWALGVLVLLPAPMHAQQFDVKTVIQRSVAANQRDWKVAPEYSYSERDREDDGAKTYEVSMLLGSPYRRLVAVNDKPLSQANQSKEQRRLEQTIARRRAESKAARAARTATYEKERRRDQLLMDQLAIAFDFRPLREEKIGSYDAYVLEAIPKPRYHPPNMEAHVLTGMQGKLWIDKTSFQWVKVEAEVVHPVSIAGFLARVERGTRFELEKTPVADGVWLPSHFAMESRAKVLNVFSRKEKKDETYFGYHRAGSIEPTRAGNGASNTNGRSSAPRISADYRGQRRDALGGMTVRSLWRTVRSD